MSFALSCMLLGIFVFCPETDGRNLTWKEPPPTQIVQATVYPVNHNSSRQLFAGTTNATLRWRFALADLKFTSLVIFFEGNSVARVSSEVTGTPPNYAHRFGLDWNPNQNLLKLFIFNVTAEENGTFSCRVTAESLDKFSEFHFASDVQVDVVGAPSNNIITSSNQTITAPAELTLNCSADGQPKPTITWTRVSDNTVVTMPLNIIDGKNEQIYRCTADNGVGNPLTKDVIINILFSPKVTLAEKFFVGRGETASLFCQVEGNPKPTISWSSCDLQNVLCDTQYLNISKVETACAIYNCTATNALGIDSATTVLIAGGYNIYMRLGIGGECSGEDSVWKALEKELMGKSHNKESFGNLSLNASSITGIPPVEQTSTAASTSTLPNSDGSAGTPWAIIGVVVVGVVVLVIVVSVLIWWVHKQRKCGKDTEMGRMDNRDHLWQMEMMAQQEREAAEGIPKDLGPVVRKLIKLIQD